MLPRGSVRHRTPYSRTHPRTRCRTSTDGAVRRAAYSASMDQTGRPADQIDLSESESGALADAAEIVARAATDEAAADEARARFRREGPPNLPPDERIAPLLESGERLVAVRHAALLDRREPAPGERRMVGAAGDLYVTSQRIVLVGRLTLAVALEAIEDAVLSGDRLLLVLREGRGITLQVGQPRLLCVEIAAARAAFRSAQVLGVDAGPPPPAR